MRRLTCAAALLATLCLTACGGDHEDSTAGGMTATPAPTPTPQRGDLLENPPAQVGSYAPRDLLDIAGQNDVGKAARAALPVATAASIVDDGKLFIAGYSQGGYIAMATHRAMQAAGVSVTAAAPMSGPYALSAFGDGFFDSK